MRTAARSLEIAELAVRWREAGVVGFDIAGAEEGFPPTRHLDAFEYVAARTSTPPFMPARHFGLPSIWEAVSSAEPSDSGTACASSMTSPALRAREELGRLGRLRARPAHSVGVVPDVEHRHARVQDGCRTSDRMLRRLRFRVTVNTDNRLMSATSDDLREWRQLREAFGWGLDDFEWLTSTR
jgi:adenosine deaminase